MLRTECCSFDLMLVVFYADCLFPTMHFRATLRTAHSVIQPGVCLRCHDWYLLELYVVIPCIVYGPRLHKPGILLQIG